LVEEEKKNMQGVVLLEFCWYFEIREEMNTARKVEVESIS